jgi:hypothetical protein
MEVAQFEAEALCIFVARGQRTDRRHPGILLKGDEQPRKNEIQELHAKEVGVGNPSEERASS